ncbi:MAG: hypothetical protein H0T76_24485 [Nannocystis sp.]|nr:hypothetical protein [Nannocystis sp.]MBA3549648.1 hypothetical protein [Nannocystis sp.]
MHPFTPVTKSPKLLRPPPRVDHLAASGRATLACPPDGRNARHPGLPAGRPQRICGST